MKAILTAAAAILTILYACSPGKQAAGLSESDVTNMVNAKDFAFRADQMLPSGGKTRVLTEAYLFRVSPQEINSDLPYMGRAYTANISTTDGGMRFTSRDFTYEQSPGKKNSWSIVIKPKDQADVRECILTVFSNGFADLSINSNNRQPIRYNGHIQPNTRQ